MNNKEIEDALEKNNEEELREIFRLLSENVSKAFKFIPPNDVNVIEEGIQICLDKKHRFVPGRGKAFNFFTTIILGHYRQLYRTVKNYNELKVRYNEFLKNK